MISQSPSTSCKNQSTLHRRREARRALPRTILERNDAVLKHLGLAHLGAQRQLNRGDGERDDPHPRRAKWALIRAPRSIRADARSSHQQLRHAENYGRNPALPA